MQLLRANKPSYLSCLLNPEHEMLWDSDQAVFMVNYDDKMKKVVELNERIGEILVWSDKFDFQTTYIARQEDFDVLEMF